MGLIWIVVSVIFFYFLSTAVGSNFKNCVPYRRFWKRQAMITKWSVFVVSVALMYLVLNWTYLWVDYNNHYSPHWIFGCGDLTTKKETIQGYEKMKDKKVVICGLIRDKADLVSYNKERMTKLGSMFKSYKILIVENDSSDETRPLLLQWARSSNDTVQILGCGSVNEEECLLSLQKTEAHNYKPSRIEKMVTLRNIYLEYIERNLDDFDYMVVWDIDLVSSLYWDGIANTVNYMEVADGICSHGVQLWPIKHYHDPYSHQDSRFTHISSTNKEYEFFRSYTLIHDYQCKEPMAKVDSCFGGFMFYNVKSVLGKRYKMVKNYEKGVFCEHNALNFQLHKVYLNPKMIHVVHRNQL